MKININSIINCLLFVRYRLVRHMWQLNVNESLSLDANCSIGNSATQELGVDINIKNLNQVHHPLMTEISIADLILYCPIYELHENNITCKQTSYWQLKCKT